MYAGFDQFLSALVKDKSARVNVISRGGQWLKVVTEREFERANALIDPLENITKKSLV